MKTLILLIFTASLTFAQIDSLTEALKYYPLQTGNYWEYCTYIYEFPFYVDSSFYSVEITGDTILTNNKAYKIISQKSIPFNGYTGKTFERLDTSTACIYRFSTDTFFVESEYLADSLLAEPGDFYAGSFTGYYSWAGSLSTLCLDEYQDTIILDYSTSIKDFEDQSGIPVVNFSLAKGLGFITSNSYEFGGGITTLRYAKIDGAEYGTQITSINDEKIIQPEQYILYQNYPNPFNPVTNIEYSIPQSGIVVLKVYDVLGNEIKTLVNEEKNSGRYNVSFDGTNLASGIYFYVLRAGNFVQSRKMLLLK